MQFDPTLVAEARSAHPVPPPFQGMLDRSDEAACVAEIVSDRADRLLDLRIVSVNAALERLSGYDAPDLLGHPPGLLYGLRTDRETVRRLDRAVRIGQPVAGRLITYDSAGAGHLSRISLTPIADSDGRLTHIAFTLRRARAGVQRMEPPRAAVA